MAGTGGALPGGGRPKGSRQKLTTQARADAMAMGLLPHEWLLKITRGEAIEQRSYIVKRDRNGKIKSKELVIEDVYPNLEQRIDCAKAAASYYAPKLSTQQVTASLGLSANPDEVQEVASKILGAIAAALPN